MHVKYFQPQAMIKYGKTRKIRKVYIDVSKNALFV